MNYGGQKDVLLYPDMPQNTNPTAQNQQVHFELNVMGYKDSV